MNIEFWDKLLRFASSAGYAFLKSGVNKDFLDTILNFKFLGEPLLPSNLDYISEATAEYEGDVLALYDGRFIRIPSTVIYKLFEKYNLHPSSIENDEDFCSHYWRIAKRISNKELNYFPNSQYIYFHNLREDSRYTLPGPEYILKEELMHYHTARTTSISNLLNVLMWFNRIYKTLWIRLSMSKESLDQEITIRYFYYIVLTYRWLLDVKNFHNEVIEAYMRWFEIFESNKISDPNAIDQVYEYHTQRGNNRAYLDLFHKISKNFLDRYSRDSSLDSKTLRDIIQKVSRFMLNTSIEDIFLKNKPLDYNYVTILDLLNTTNNNKDLLKNIKRIIEADQGNISSFTHIAFLWIYRQGFPANLTTIEMLMKLLFTRAVAKTVLSPLQKRRNFYDKYPGLLSYETTNYRTLHICDPITKHSLSKVKTRGIEMILLNDKLNFYGKVLHFSFIFIIRFYYENILDHPILEFLFKWMDIESSHPFRDKVENFLKIANKKWKDILESHHLYDLFPNSNYSHQFLSDVLKNGDYIVRFQECMIEFNYWLRYYLKKNGLSSIVYPFYLHGFV